MPKLENWSMVNRNENSYQAPEQGIPALSGEVYNHPRFEDGLIVTTSSIINKKGENVLTYSGSEYELGKVSEEYEKIYPDAKERLLNSLKEKESE